MRQLFQDDTSEAVILVDAATNTFYSLNREAALHNIKYLCPSLATVLINTYRDATQLFIEDKTLFSCEETKQGDPLAMVMYAIGTLPLSCRLQPIDTKQAWFADDATAGGELTDIKDWSSKLQKYGPIYEYFPNPSKTWLIVKVKSLDKARDLFGNAEINITTEGKRHLGAALGSREFVEQYVNGKVMEWRSSIVRLAGIAKTQPQAAYSALTHGLMGKWNFFFAPFLTLHI